jgi:hypothetical protein
MKQDEFKRMARQSLAPKNSEYSRDHKIIGRKLNGN